MNSLGDYSDCKRKQVFEKTDNKITKKKIKGEKYCLPFDILAKFPVPPVTIGQELNLQEKIDFQYFRKVTTMLINPESQVATDGQRIIITYHEIQKPLKKRDVKGVLRFLECYPQDFLIREQESLEKLKEKLIFNSDFSIQDYIAVRFANLFGKSHVQREEKFFSIVHKVAAAPQTVEEFLKNTSLYFQNYPKYQFDNDAGLFEARYGHPKHFHPLKAFRTLKGLIDSLDETTKLALQELLQETKPQKVILAAFILEDSTNNNYANVQTAKNYIGNDIPAVISKIIYDYDPKTFNQLFKAREVYIQDPGSFLVILPSNSLPEEYGFSKDLKLWDKRILIQNPPEVLMQDLDSLLLEDQEETGFLRILSLNGHSYSNLSRNPLIVGLSPKIFKESFEVLKRKNVKFLDFNGCYLGGSILREITLPNGKIPCPMHIRSSSDAFGLLSNLDTIILNNVSNRLFTTKSDQFIISEHSISKGGLQGVAETIKRATINNLPSLLLPSTSDKVQVPFTRTNVFDLHMECARTKVKQGMVKKIKINRDIILFSDPVMPVRLISRNNNMLALMSRGGHAHHVIAELETEEELEQIAYRTFNLLMPEEGAEYEFANKVFAIGKLKNKQTLEHVVFCNVRFVDKDNPGVRYVYFKKPDEDFFWCMKFELKDRAHYFLKQKHWLLTDQIKVNKETAIIGIYMQLAFTSPSLVNKEEEQFYDGFDELFWHNKPPIDASFYRSILCQRQIFSRSPGEERVSPKEIYVTTDYRNHLLSLIEKKDIATLTHGLKLLHFILAIAKERAIEKHILYFEKKIREYPLQNPKAGQSI